MTDQATFDEGTQNPFDSILNEITNDEGQPKYTSAEDALKSIAPAQKHIQDLEAENAQLREQAAKNAAAEELLAKVNSQPQGEQTSSTVGLDEAKARELFESMNAEAQAAAARSQNQAKVRDALVDFYGEKAKETFEAKATEVGMNIADFDDLAARSPEAVLRLFDLKANKEPVMKNITGSVNTTGTQPAPSQKPRESIMGPGKDSAVLSRWKELKAEVTAEFGG